MKSALSFLGRLPAAIRVRGGLASVTLLMAALLETGSVWLIYEFVRLVSAGPSPALRAVFRGVGWTSAPDLRDSFVSGAGLVLLLFFSKAMIVWLGVRFRLGWINDVRIHVCRAVLHKILNQPYSHFLTTRHHELIHQMTDDISRLVDQVLAPVMALVGDGLIVILIAGLLASLHLRVTLCMVVILAAALGILLGVVQVHAKRAGLEYREVSVRIVGTLSNAFLGIREVKLFGRESFVLHSYVRDVLLFRRVFTTFASLIELQAIFVETVAVVGMVVVTAGISLTVSDRAAVLPTLTLFAFGMLKMVPSLSRVLQAAAQVAHALPAVDSMLPYLEDVPREGEASPDTGAGQERSQSELRFGNAITLRDVTFAYPGRPEPVLRSFSAELPRGASIAIIGPSGSGKSTLVDLIAGLLVPTDGAVLVDGVDVRAGLGKWQQSLSYLSQTPTLFRGTIRENLEFGARAGKCGDEELWRVLDTVRLRSFVESLPLKLDSSVGDRGMELSGGQRQRLALGRCLLRDPEVIILDEGTSSLDAETEQALLDELFALKGSRTLLVVSHDPAVAARCDRQVRMVP